MKCKANNVSIILALPFTASSKKSLPDLSTMSDIPKP